MRIVLSNASYAWGGVHSITETLADGFQRRGHDVLVLCRAGSILEERLRGRFPLAPVARGMDLSPLAIARIARELRRFRADVVLGLTEKDQRLAAPAARLRGIPAVARRLNDRPIPGGPYGRFIYGALVSHHIANSEATRRTFLASAPWLPPERVTVVHNGIDVEAHARAEPAALPLPADAVVVGLVGRLETRKGVRDLLAAWPAVAAAAPRAHLVVAGRGPLEGEVAEAARRLERVVFLGYRSDAASVMARCDVVTVPSHWEGFGLVAAEALAVGKPVVAADASSLPEIVRHEREGLLVPPRAPDALAAALLRLIGDPELRARLGAAGRARVRERFRHDRMVDETEAVLRRAAGR